MDRIYYVIYMFTVSRDGKFSNMFATILKWNVRKAAHCSRRGYRPYQLGRLNHLNRSKLIARERDLPGHHRGLSS